MSVDITAQKEALEWANGHYSSWPVDKVVDDLVKGVQEWFYQNGKGCTAVIGISGGKDSSVAAALMVRALGKDRVIGVLMPQGEQKDIRDAQQLVNFLEIKNFTINIADIVNLTYATVEKAIGFEHELSKQAKVNTPPRARMMIEYCLSQSFNGRFINTCNLSEDWVGYSTRYGDSAGDYGPLSRFTVEEVKRIGRYLGLPTNLVDKIPADGLTDLSDEDNLGFTYAVLDMYIRTGKIANPETKKLIDRKHEQNLFKLLPLATFEYDPTKYCK